MVVAVVSIFFSVFPEVTSLPFNLDVYLANGFGYINFLAGVFPPLAIMLTGFLWILGWKLAMVIVRMVPFLNKLIRHYV